MRKNFTRTLLLLTFFLLSYNSQAIILPGSTVPKAAIELMCKKLATMKVKDFEKVAGHRLKLSDKVAFMMIKSKAKRISRHGISAKDYAFIQQNLLASSAKNQLKKENNSSLGQTSLIVGIIAAGLLIAGLFLPVLLLGSLGASIAAIVIGSSALKANHSDQKARAGKLLGWITLGLLVVLALLIAVIIASWAWAWW